MNKVFLILSLVVFAVSCSNNSGDGTSEASSSTSGAQYKKTAATITIEGLAAPESVKFRKSLEMANYI